MSPTLETLEDRTLPSFASAVDYAVGAQPGSVAVGDFRGIGRLDLAVSNITDSSVSILLGNGDGTFAPAVNYPAGVGARSLTVGDFRGIGILDLAVVSHGLGPGAQGNVSILLGNGDGTFQPAVDYPIGRGSDGIAVGDFNGDGTLDLAVCNYASSTISILDGVGDGTFRPAVNYPTGHGPTSVAVGDFNGDGKPDLAVTNRQDGTVSILLNDGHGAFPTHTEFSADSQPFFVVAGDFHQTGSLDLAVANRQSGDVSILQGNGDGTFQSAVNYPTDVGPWSLAVGDFNGNGRLDLAVTNEGRSSGGSVSILLNNGDGTFQSAVTYPSAPDTRPFSVTAGDFNGDGAPDLAVADAGSNNVSVLLNQPDATHFQVTTPDTVTAGAPFDVTVTALSGFNTVVTNYTGTVTFTSSDPGSTLPADYTFTAADNGVHTFPGGGTLFVAGSQTITGTDTANSSLTGSATLTVDPGMLDHLGLSGPDHVTADEPFAVTVTARDAYNNTITGYLGTVTFSSADSGHGLPADYTFTTDDQGVHVFSGVILHDVGAQTITVSDTLDPTIAGLLALRVDPPGH
jgi:hypothetical protein